tara:strand:+ start:55946 stop:56662 length:717 start_codon:yes stop_codon:yes gene_type:complete
MLASTKAIVLHKVKYSETSLVIQVFSREYGKISILVNGVRKNKSRTKSALFEPLSIIEFAGNFKNTEKLIHPNGIKLTYPFIGIQTHMAKRMMALFLSEILHKSIKEPQPDPEMFDYMEGALKFLDISSSNYANFHLVFLFQLTRYLGFYPRLSDGEYFNMMEGNFSSNYLNTPSYLHGETVTHFRNVLGTKFDTLSALELNNIQRRETLQSIISYYQIHIHGLGEIHSHHILEKLFK